MSKPFDGGISSAPFERLMTEIEHLQIVLFKLTSRVAVEEHQSSLVDQTKIQAHPPKCAEITSGRSTVDVAIGTSHTSPGLIKVLFECNQAVSEFIHKVDALTDIYAPVTTEPTGGPGHC